MRIFGTEVRVETIKVEVVVLEHVVLVTPMVLGEDRDVLYAGTEVVDHDAFLADIDAGVADAIRRTKAWLELHEDAPKPTPLEDSADAAWGPDSPSV